MCSDFEITDFAGLGSIWGRGRVGWGSQLSLGFPSYLGWDEIFAEKIQGHSGASEQIIIIIIIIIISHSAQLGRSWFPNQGLNLGPPQCKQGVLTIGLPGSSPE